MSKLIWGGKEKYGNYFKQNVFLSLGRVLCFSVALLISLFLSLLLKETRENRNPVRENVRVRLEEHFAHIFITSVLQFFDSSFNRPSFLLMSHSEICLLLQRSVILSLFLLHVRSDWRILCPLSSHSRDDVPRSLLTAAGRVLVVPAAPAVRSPRASCFSMVASVTVLKFQDSVGHAQLPLYPWSRIRGRG